MHLPPAPNPESNEVVSAPDVVPVERMEEEDANAVQAPKILENL